MLRATTPRTFSTSQLPKVVRSSSVLSILTWKCASRHNGVHFFMSHLASWLRTRRFSEPTFRPSGATNHWKNTVNRDFPIFSRICIFFLLILSLLTRSFHLCFSTVHIVGSFTSKLPSTIYLSNISIYFPILPYIFSNMFHIFFQILPYIFSNMTIFYHDYYHDAAHFLRFLRRSSVSVTKTWRMLCWTPRGPQGIQWIAVENSEKEVQH